MLQYCIGIILLNIILVDSTLLRESINLEHCKNGFYLDTGTLHCLSCPANSSMITSDDGFSCSCDENSIKINVGRCRKCNSTEVLTPDGTACVPRRCMKDASSRLTCRKCPTDYIVVTQNFDGSPLKEVQCIKCTRGYRASSGQCVKCEDCMCAKSELAVKGQCLPRRYITNRAKPETNVWHPNDVLDIVKYEYLCMVGDIRACRSLASKCVRSMYNTDRGGACRLWIQTPLLSITGLPELTLTLASTDELQPGEIRLKPKMNSVRIVLMQHDNNGGINIVEDQNCMLPKEFDIGTDFLHKCNINVTELLKYDGGNNLAPYLEMDGKLVAIPISIKTPGGNLIQRGLWKSSSFRRYFVAEKSSFENSTSVIYLRNLNIQLRLRREKPLSGLLIMHLQLVAEYDTLPSYSTSAVIFLTLKHQLPSAGVLRALEIWGGVLGALATFYAMIQWRGSVRRGGPTVSLGPILSGCVADALYTSAIMASLHTIASETATTGLALPLAAAEEYTIEALLYSALGLKIVKAIWLNWCQCRCDVFLLDWGEYNPSIKEKENYNCWGTVSVAREWLALQTERRVSPAFTVPISLAVLQLMNPWQSSLPNSRGYHCAVIAIAWWSGYVLVALIMWIERRLSGSPPAVIPRVCRATGVSLLVFQEEYLAHYVNGRNEDAIDLRALTGPLTSCRVICAQQLRAVYKQLFSHGLGDTIDSDARRSLLTKFLAAFFERALDGLSWIASERTVLERLLDVELNVRENISTSVLLYDQQPTTPTCMNVTWWGEEGNLALLDATLFTGVFLGCSDAYISAFTVLIVWQVMKYIRAICGRRNFRTKTKINENWFK